jgi:hypothetical protein
MITPTAKKNVTYRGETRVEIDLFPSRDPWRLSLKGEGLTYYDTAKQRGRILRVLGVRSNLPPIALEQLFIGGSDNLLRLTVEDLERGFDPVEDCATAGLLTHPIIIDPNTAQLVVRAPDDFDEELELKLICNDMTEKSRSFG